MHVFILFLLLLPALFAASPDELKLVLRAQTDFDRVEMSPVPRIDDAIACVQSQAALIPVAAPAEVSLVYFRRGYCELTGAILSHRPQDAAGAATDFDKAISSWSPRSKAPVSSGLRILAVVARLEAGEAPDPPMEGTLNTAIREGSCPGTDMSAGICRSVLDTGRMWLGWIAWQQGDSTRAVQIFQAFPQSGWYALASGNQRKALDIWLGPQPAGLTRLLEPQPDIPDLWFRLAVDQLRKGGHQAAIESFTASLKGRPMNAQAIFLRGRARELAGDEKAAMADYELASRTAFAADLVSAAHYYRGVWLFRRNDYQRAENEFASAQNFNPGSEMKPDVVAWWHMSAVAQGSCNSSADLLRRDLQSVSPFFPKSGAESLLRGCRSYSSAGNVLQFR